MLKRELKVNLKNFIIWISVLIGLFLFVYLLYPSIISSGELENLDEMLKIFPPELLKSLNMDIATMDTAFGWIKTEGWVFVLLLIGAYSGLLGGTILLKEESDKTIEYLGCLPISRTRIVIEKTVAGLIYIILMVIIFLLFNYISLTLSGNFDKDVFLMLSLTPLLPSIVLFTLSMFIGTFFRKTKKITGIVLGITLASYLFNIFSELSEVTEFLKYISVFTLADIRGVIQTGQLDLGMVVLTVLLTIILTGATIYRYNKKEFI